MTLRGNDRKEEAEVILELLEARIEQAYAMVFLAVMIPNVCIAAFVATHLLTRRVLRERDERRARQEERSRGSERRLW